MNVYRVGYDSYEESPRRYLVHDKKFDEREFQHMVVLAVENIIRAWLDRPFSLDSEHAGRISRFEDVVPHSVAEYLIAEHGFRELQLTADASFDGWASIVPTEDGFPTSQHNELNQAATAHLTSQGLAEKIIEKNEYNEKELMRQLDQDLGEGGGWDDGG